MILYTRKEFPASKSVGLQIKTDDESFKINPLYLTAQYQ